MTTPLCKIARETGGKAPPSCLFGCPHRCVEPQPVPGGLTTIIAGSREGVTGADLGAALASCPWRPSVVISGGARGADALGERWAAARGIPVIRMEARWQRPDGSTDRGAGHRRNERMAERAEALVAIWDGRSPGTRHMISTALARGLRVHMWKPGSAR